MRFMVLVPANEESESGALPSDEIIDAMSAYNEELAKAGVLLDLSGLHPTSKGARVRFSGGTSTVIDGPFTESKELIAGYWVLDVASRDEAIEWVKRSPFSQFVGEGEIQIEIRQLFELDDFDDSPAVERARELEKQLSQKK